MNLDRYSLDLFRKSKGLYINYFVMTRRYTKADLEQIVSMQYQNLNAIHDLLSIMKHQNELLTNANKKLSDEIKGVKEKLYSGKGLQVRKRK